MSFNLLTEPWIPCVVDGVVRRLGIADALRESHRVTAIAESSPLARFALYRLLLAVAHWWAPLEDEAAWISRWGEGCLSLSAIDRRVGDAADRFDLFDASRPFYQSADDLPERPVSAAKLIPEIPTATYKNHFCHPYDTQTALCPACCAKGLAMLPPFCTGVGAGNEASINGTPPLYFLPRGHTLFHTLMLSMPSPDPAVRAQDVPAWEDRTRGQTPIGFLEGLTWQPRRVRLRPRDPNGARCSFCGERAAALVLDILFTRGRSRNAERNRDWRDPHAAYPEEGRALVPSDPQAAKGRALAFWREQAKAIYAEDDRVPSAIRTADIRLAAVGSAPGPQTVEVFAFHTSKADFIAARSTEWPWLHQLRVGGGLVPAITRMLQEADALARRIEELLCVDAPEYEPWCERVFLAALYGAAEGTPPHALHREWERSLNDYVDRLEVAEKRARYPYSPSRLLHARQDSMRRLAAIRRALRRGGDQP